MARRKEEASLRFTSAARTISKASGGVGVGVGVGTGVGVATGTVVGVGTAASQAIAARAKAAKRKNNARFIRVTVARDAARVLGAYGRQLYTLWDAVGDGIQLVRSWVPFPGTNLNQNP